MLEHEATRRALNLATDSLNKEKLLLKATESELLETKDDLKKHNEEHFALECKLQNITEKFNELETILGKFLLSILFYFNT